MKHKNHPSVGACGIDCGLCPMHHVRDGDGCRGCAAPPISGRSGRWCPIARCAVQERNRETCADCHAYPCELLEDVDASDSFVTHLKMIENLRFIRENGLCSFLLQQRQRQAVLQTMLAEFNDGRSKSHFCLASALLPLDMLEMALAAALAAKGGEDLAGKGSGSRAQALRSELKVAADILGISLKLRR